jgi:hypothetical protein
MMQSGSVVVYGGAVLTGALLLFSVQPLTGRLLLPRFGGAPSVWAACLVFFQGCLLLGYVYAHVLARWVPKPAQVLVHGALIGTALLLAPLDPPSDGPRGTFPGLWLLIELSGWLALPTVAVASTSPLVQHWFGYGRHRSASDPYFLYAASNLGSLLGLWGYPILVEPWLTLKQQLVGWRWGLMVLAGCEVGCLLLLWHRRSTPTAVSRASGSAPCSTRITAMERLRWAGLAMIPSALLQGITAYLTTDLAPVPLLWVMPLGLYLLSYVLAFRSRPLVAHEKVVGWALTAVLAMAFLLAAGLTQPLVLVLPTHCAAFFVLCWACHAELARRRPALVHLTEFYLMVALGGVLGGCSAAMLAPWLFNSLLEYPLSAILVVALLTWVAGPDQLPAAWRAVVEEREERRWERLLRTLRAPVAIALLAASAVWAVRSLDPVWSPFLSAPLAMVACVLAHALKARPRAFAVASATILLMPFLLPSQAEILFERRTFFGVHRVLLDPSHARRVYVQGTTIHGLQSLAPDRARVPGAYFHPTGPAGEVLRIDQPARLGLVGLGVGALAAFAERGQSYTFFEIDPAVACMAEDPRLFTFLVDARHRAAQVRVVLGDGRLKLAESPANSFDLVVIDAYTSDVVPTHLLTRQAFGLYFQRLTPEGLVLLNISNRHLDLGRVVGAVAESGGYYALERFDALDTPEQLALAERDGKAVSRWIVMGRTERAVRRLQLGPKWKRLASLGERAWTDDYANIVGALAWWPTRWDG